MAFNRSINNNSKNDDHQMEIDVENSHINVNDAKNKKINNNNANNAEVIPEDVIDLDDNDYNTNP